MSPQEAAALLNIDLQEDLEEQIEQVIFELKQKIYRQLDQLLLYPKWFKELDKIERAAQVLAIKWCPSAQHSTTLQSSKIEVIDTHLPMLALFNQYQVLRNAMALQFQRALDPQFLATILKEWSEVQKQYLAYWSKLELTLVESQLTAQFDPQVIFLTLQELKEKGVVYLQDLKNTEIPKQLQAYISWAQKLWSRLQAN
ncbi:MAG: hypothetical protein K9J18_03010 [Crocinitomicaceae bacterium]|jgi:hypothetical protein|nr:hypothetical protein [Crocinitomicaceae bacterium]